MFRIWRRSMLSRLICHFRRDPRSRLLRRMPSHAVCAEIGVWKGDFSQQILDQTQPKELHLIDPWSFRPAFPKRWYGGVAATDQADMDRIYGGVVERFSNHPEVRIHRAPSSDLPEILGSRKLDWIYIDGDHSEAAVAADLEICHHFVRSGGWIVGDDYFWLDERGNQSVRTAVEAFAGARSLQLRLIGGQFIIANRVGIDPPPCASGTPSFGKKKAGSRRIRQVNREASRLGDVGSEDPGFGHRARTRVVASETTTETCDVAPQHS